MLRSRHIVWMIAALSIAAGCKVYDESLLLDGTAGFGGGGTSYGDGVGWWSGTDPASKCATASMPTSDDRPKTSDPGESVPPITFGVRTMRLGALDPEGKYSETAWQGIGFDLDATCTRSPTCEQLDPVVSCSTKPVVPNDGMFCRDNMFGRMEYAIATNEDIGVRFGLNDRTFNCSLCEGAYNMLFRISDYNGQPNDAAVRIDIYPSPGIDTLKPIDCETATEWTQDECWQQSDPWAVQADYVQDPVGSTDIGNSTLDDPSGYVREGYAVVKLPSNSRFWFPGDRGVATAFPIVLQGGLVTGKLVEDEDGSWRLEDGIIAGRMKVQDAIDSFRLIGMCEGDQFADLVTGYANSWADVLSTGEVLPETPCDALSVGIAFTASEATMGKVTEVVIPDPCAPDAGADGGADAGAGDAADGG